MPINKDKHHRVYVTLTIEEHDRVLAAVRRIKRSGYKTSASKYIADVLRSHFEHEELFKDNGANS